MGGAGQRKQEAILKKEIEQVAIDCGPCYNEENEEDEGDGHLVLNLQDFI